MEHSDEVRCSNSLLGSISWRCSRRNDTPITKLYSQFNLMIQERADNSILQSGMQHFWKTQE